jgi:hypothetical protein
MEGIPYRPSWIDRLTAWIERLPIPAWVSYVIAALPLIAVFVSVQAWQGAYSESGFNVWHLFLAIQLVYPVAVIHYLDRVGARALHRFLPVFEGDQDDLDAARYRLTTLPARPTLVACALGLLAALAQVVPTVGDIELSASFQSVAPTKIGVAISLVNISIAWFLYGGLIYHTYHQLRVIDWLYTQKADIDPFHPEPLYALSETTSRTAVVILVTLYAFFLTTARGVADPFSGTSYLLTNVFWMGLGVLAFIWPLLGAHELLVDAKISAIQANAQSYKVAAQELHASVQAQALDKIDVWRNALLGLDTERKYLDRLATWPWSPGAFRNVLVALVIPIAVWIVQFLLQRLLG